MIWLVFALLTACVILAVARPFGTKTTRSPDARSEVEAYRSQLTELNRDAERGTIGRDEAEQTRAEIARRLLRASRSAAVPAGNAGASPIPANAVFMAISIIIAAGALGLYSHFGKAGMPDEPLEARLSAPPDKQPVQIQIANVERRLRARPNDGLGWSVIAPVYFRMGQFEKAADAFRKAIAINGPDEDKLLGLAEALTFANNGVISDDAKQVLSQAVALSPKSLRARFWVALLAEQDGRKADAEKTYREMLGETIPEAWRTMTRNRLASLTASQTATAAANDRADPSGDNDAQGDQRAMIRGMVERLATRLHENKDDLEGWLRLIRSYVVLKEAGKAHDALLEARQQFAADAKALAQIDDLAQGLALNSNVAPGTQPKS